VIHDVACVEKKRPWNMVHENFYYGMLASGVEPPRAKVMYAAVYHFGPRWSTPNAPGVAGGSAGLPPPITMTASEFDALAREIELRDRAGDPISLREIRQFSR
jgi:hypothetical protein